MNVSRRDIIRRIQRVTELPSVPQVALSLHKEISKSEMGVSIERIVSIIQDDPALVSRCLKIANSAFYEGMPEVKSIRQAVIRLGMNEMRMVALATAVLSRYSKFGGEDPKVFWLHAIAVAMASNILTQFVKVELAVEQLESTFTAALLHDLGAMVLAYLYPKLYATITKKVVQEGELMSDLERREWGIDHGEAGEILARMWHLPEEICQVIRFHHHPWEAVEQYRQLVNIVHIANAICTNQGYGRAEILKPELFHNNSWDALGLSTKDAPLIIQRVTEEGQRSELFVDLVR